MSYNIEEKKEILSFFKESFDFEDKYTKKAIEAVLESKAQTNRLIYKSIFLNKIVKMVNKSKHKNASIAVIKKSKGNIDDMDNIKTIEEFIKQVKKFDTVPTDTWCNIMNQNISRLRKFKKEFQTAFQINSNLLMTLYIAIVFDLYEECNFILNKSVAYISDSDKYELLSTKRVCDGLTFKSLKAFFEIDDRDLKLLFNEASKGTLYILKEDSIGVEDGNEYMDYIHESTLLPTRIILTINNIILHVIREPIAYIFRCKYSLMDYIENIKLFLEYNTTSNKNLTDKTKSRQKTILDLLNKGSQIFGLERQKVEKEVDREIAKTSKKKQKYENIEKEVPEGDFVF